MNFARRIKLFFIGMLLGTGVVILFFGDKLNLFTSWMPNDRVLLRLQQTDLQMTSKAKCLLDCYEITRSEIDDLIFNGNVNFSESKTQQKPLEYRVDHENEILGNYFLVFEAADSVSTITNARLPNSSKACECD